MLKHSITSGLLLTAVHQVVKKDFSTETVMQIASNDMIIRGIGSHKIDLLKKLPE